jgi:hypothetical protein
MQHVFNHRENRPTGLVFKRSIRETASDLRYISDAWATYLMTRDRNEPGFHDACTLKIALVRDCLAYHGWNEATWWEAVDATNNAGDLYKIEALGDRREY